MEKERGRKMFAKVGVQFGPPKLQQCWPLHPVRADGQEHGSQFSLCFTVIRAAIADARRCLAQFSAKE